MDSPTPAAIFSPSVARLAASTAKDWNYVDSWLSSKFHGRAAPPFERNPETLKVLLALAALNETADEERDAVARLEASALQELQGSERSRNSLDAAESAARLQEDILEAIEDGLSREGSTALDSMATAAVALGIAYPAPEVLGRKTIGLQAQVFELEQTIARVGVLHRYVAAEAAQARALLRDLARDEYRPAADLAKSNLEMKRRIKATAARLPDTTTAGMRTHDSMAEHPIEITIQQVRKEEEGYLELLAHKRHLDTQLAAFQGLPPDRELARQELEALRAELRAITRHRDAFFEGLVERHTPAKGKRPV